MNIGFVGLGIMGSAMAANLVKAGFCVTVWNRTAAKSEALAALGAQVAKTPRAVAEASEIVFSMMSTPEAAELVRDGADGIVAGLCEGKGFVDMSTVDADTSLISSCLVKAAGAMFLEAPVAGSRKPAEDGQLIIMAAGDRALYDKAMPAFEKLGKKMLYLGDVGNGARMKLANNLVMGGMMTALAEGVALAERSGLSPAQLLDVLDAGAMSNPMFRLKGPAIVAKNQYPAAFPLKHMQKDLRLALRMGEECGQTLYATATSNELFKEAVSKGYGDEDFAAVCRVVRVEPV